MKWSDTILKSKKITKRKSRSSNNRSLKRKYGYNKRPKMKNKVYRFPFWARLKINKNRTTLVIDEVDTINKKTNRIEPGYIHRESIHVDDEQVARRKGYERIYPNPDRTDSRTIF